MMIAKQFNYDNFDLKHRAVQSAATRAPCRAQGGNFVD